jgi:hypothetical protein
MEPSAELLTGLSLCFLNIETARLDKTIERTRWAPMAGLPNLSITTTSRRQTANTINSKCILIVRGLCFVFYFCKQQRPIPTPTTSIHPDLVRRRRRNPRDNHNRQREPLVPSLSDFRLKRDFSDVLVVRLFFGFLVFHSSMGGWWLVGGRLDRSLVLFFFWTVRYIFSLSLSGNRLPMSVNLSLTAPRETLRWPDDRNQRTCSRVLLHRT